MEVFRFLKTAVFFLLFLAAGISLLVFDNFTIVYESGEIVLTSDRLANRIQAAKTSIKKSQSQAEACTIMGDRKEKIEKYELQIICG